MTDEAVAILLPMLVRFEGLRLKPYLCPAGVPTIAVGLTMYPDGRKVTMHDAPMTETEAMESTEWLVRHVYLPQTVALCPGIDTPERLAAITDFCFNLGAGALKVSTLRRKINAGAWDQVPAELRKWVRGGGRTLPGLVKRREAECALVEKVKGAA